MNNFYALIYLTEELKPKFLGQPFHFSYSPHKDVWEGYVGHENDSQRLIFGTNPSETALFADKHRGAKKTNVTEFFNELKRERITEIELAEQDRILTIYFGPHKKLLFQIFGNKPNVFLIKDGIITESFKGGREFEGEPEPKPRPPKEKTWPDKKLSAKRSILHFFPAFPRHLVDPVIEHFNLENKPMIEVQKAAESIVDAMLNRPEFRILSDGNLCLIPQDLLPAENLKVFDNVNDAIRFAYYKTSRERRLAARVQTFKPKLEETLNRNESTIHQLEDAEKGLERAEKYEEFGHLLMAHAHQKTDGGTESITIPNFYDDNKPVEIPLKPKQSIAENAQRYYDKSAKAIRSVEESKNRLKKLKKETKSLKAILRSFQEIEKIYEFDDWFKENEDELKRLGVLSKAKQVTSLPYRRTTIEGYEVWIGKNAKSNDQLTTDAHKEDIWLHARGVSGSHVVIRMNNQKEMPPKRVIQKAAALAAWNSKAKGSKLAPVIVTKRKYVTKPKGSPTGAVRVQREEVEMVQPQKEVS
ncbi:NFACT RNA binding domain-containing protein [Rhodohalobacter halophilus]|uniref:NFACT RNA binding domain-containing protein n=1 Tax=Rhodohalobacter halophilus TaxID=1812810 RepID=UPI00083F718C|nr:NFACT RNA binding domain-containing protein [Rhodohalobacter halophilus]